MTLHPARAKTDNVEDLLTQSGVRGDFLTQGTNVKIQNSVNRVVAWVEPSDAALAAHWATRLELPVHSRAEVNGLSADFALTVRAGRLELEWIARPDMSALKFEFETGPLRQRMKSLGRANPLVKSLGAFKANEVIWDISFGQGLDCLLFLKLGLSVVAFERDPFVFALAEEAVQRAKSEGALEEFIDWNKLSLRFGDAKAELSKYGAGAGAGAEDGTRDGAEGGAARPDYVYFDPMFSEVSKSLPRKEMQFFAALVGNDQDGAAVLTRARTAAKKRVVVKRSDSAPTLGEPVTHAFSSKLVRYDMYLNSSR